MDAPKSRDPPRPWSSASAVCYQPHRERDGEHKAGRGSGASRVVQGGPYSALNLLPAPDRPKSTSLPQ